MVIYYYNPETGVYLNEGTAVESPAEEGVYIIPAFATDTRPPTVGTGEVAVFSGGKWGVRLAHVDPPRSPATARIEKLAEIRGLVFNLLALEDYKVLRHMEQLFLTCATTLTFEEYMALLTKRQGIRDKSNEYENILSGLPDSAGTIDALKIEY